MARRSSTLQKFDAVFTAVNTIQLRNQGKSISQISNSISDISSGVIAQNMALQHVSSQIEGIGQMAIITLAGISEIDTRLARIETHFIAVEERSEKWSKMIAILIDLEDTIEEIKQEFETHPVFATFCLEVVEHLADKNGLQKENFHDQGHQRSVHGFRKKITEIKMQFNANLREMKLLSALNNFKSDLTKYHNLTAKLQDKNELLSKTKKELSSKKRRLPTLKTRKDLENELKETSEEKDKLKLESINANETYDNMMKETHYQQLDSELNEKKNELDQTPVTAGYGNGWYWIIFFIWPLFIMPFGIYGEYVSIGVDDDGDGLIDEDGWDRGEEEQIDNDGDGFTNEDNGEVDWDFYFIFCVVILGFGFVPVHMVHDEKKGKLTIFHSRRERERIELKNEVYGLSAQMGIERNRIEDLTHLDEKALKLQAARTQYNSVKSRLVNISTLTKQIATDEQKILGIKEDLREAQLKFEKTIDKLSPHLPVGALD